MMELFELGGIAATLVAAYQGNLLQALLNGYAIPTMYAEELGLDPTATEQVLEVLACLGEQALVRLAELGAACEDLLGAHQDIEWALSSGTLYLLQCRPVTSGGRP